MLNQVQHGSIRKDLDLLSSVFSLIITGAGLTHAPYCVILDFRISDRVQINKQCNWYFSLEIRGAGLTSYYLHIYYIKCLRLILNTM